MKQKRKEKKKIYKTRIRLCDKKAQNVKFVASVFRYSVLDCPFSLLPWSR